MKLRQPFHAARRGRTPSLATLLPLLLILSTAFHPAHAQSLNSFERERGLIMLDSVKSDLKKNYYDPNFHGMDLTVRFKQAEEKIKQATSNGQIFSIIAQVLSELEDSHTYFLPPSRVGRTDYGWQMQMIGDKCYVTAIRPKSDAEAKGLKVGDEVWTVDGFGLTRENLWKLKYVYYSLKPRGGMRVVIKKPDGQEQQLDVMAKVVSGKQVIDLTGQDIGQFIREAESEDRLHRHRYYELGEELMIWKMPQFDLTDLGVDELMDKVKKHKALILDLRGNGGGAVSTLERMVGNLFDRDIKIGEVKGRKEVKPQLGKTRGQKAYQGKLVVLVDSESGSASEVFARLIQLEKRGTVIGDRTAGAVMQSRQYPHQLGIDTIAFYGVSVTNADVIMSDGKSLEHVGVIPDEVLLPTTADMAARRDPVLSRAATLLGVTLDPDKAGTLFPVEWRK